MGKKDEIVEEQEQQTQEPSLRKIPMKRISDRIVHFRTDLEFRFLRHQLAWLDLYNGLVTEGAMLENGKYVRTQRDVFFWLLENIHKMHIES